MAYYDVLTGKYWSDETLRKACNGAKVETVNINDLNLDMKRFPGARIKDMIHHCERVHACVTRIPIILGPNNVIYDGCHRVVKAILENKTELLCHRLTELPEHDEIKIQGKWERVG